MAFGDIRVAERADWLIHRVVSTGTLVLRKLGETRAGEKAVPSAGNTCPNAEAAICGAVAVPPPGLAGDGFAGGCLRDLACARGPPAALVVVVEPPGGAPAVDSDGRDRRA